MDNDWYQNIDLTELYDNISKLAKAYEDNVVEANAVGYNGGLKVFTNDAWDTEFNNGNISVSFNLPKEWYWVEYGRKPSAFPPKDDWDNPYQDISRWAAAKGLQPSYGTFERMVWGIIGKIHREGYYGHYSEGKHLLENTLKESKSNGLITKIIGTVADGASNDIKVSLNDLAKR